MAYVWSISVHRRGFFAVLDGWCVTVYRGTNSGRWKAEFYPNAWRKSKVRICAI